MASIGWLVSFLVFLGVEMAFCCLTSLWFAVGALGAFAVALTGGAAGAFIIALTGASMEAQLAGFVAVSFLTLILIRPAAFLFNRHMAGRHRRAGGQN